MTGFILYQPGPGTILTSTESAVTAFTSKCQKDFGVEKQQISSHDLW